MRTSAGRYFLTIHVGLTWEPTATSLVLTSAPYHLKAVAILDPDLFPWSIKVVRHQPHTH